VPKARTLSNSIWQIIAVKRSARFCLDAFAWLAWLQEEPGAAAVQHCHDEAERGRAECVTSIINVGEAFYRLIRVDRRQQAETLWRMASRRTLPVAVKDATRRRVRRAAELKASHAIAYADAFAVATALEFRARLVTGDPELKPLEGEHDLEVLWLPQRS
jgi:predicted nucleic acid-binding protein